MTKYTIDTEIDVNYRDNKGKIETNYRNENETDYGDFEDINLEITRNNILLPLSQPLFRLLP